MSYQDRTMTCVECGSGFVFSADDQEFHASKGFTNDPKRCPACRQSRRASSGGGGGFSGGGFSGGYDSRPPGKCTPWCAPSAARTPKCPSSQAVKGQSIAAIASAETNPVDTSC